MTPPQITVRGGFIAKLNPAWVWPRSAVTASGAIVSGAGSAGVNGAYDYDGTKWVKGAFVMEIPLGSPNWCIRSGATIFYVAPDTEFPWQGVWAQGVGGTLPVPTVAEAAS